MASIFGSWGSDPFGELVEKATSELLPAGQEDIALNLEICDQVRAKTVPAKQAMQTLKRRLDHKNPNVVLLALGLTDICIKNGGDHFLAEVASREFMDNLASILRRPSGVNYEVKTKALKLIQDWAQISEAKPQQMSSIVDTYKALKASGFEFPPRDPKAAVSAALVETLTAPDWTDGDVCMRCRTSFTTFNRKHHCRNCGNVFCQDCSGKSMSLPWYGIGQDVRVCDGCFAKKAPSASSASRKLSRSQSSVAPSGRGGAGTHHRSNTLDSSKRSGNRQNLRKKEDDDLALAIKLSLEASGSAPSQPTFSPSSPAFKEGRPTKQADGRMLEGTDADDDPDLAAAIAASLRDYAPPAPSAPIDDGRMTPRPMNGYVVQDSRLPLPPSLELPASDVDALLTFAQNAGNQEMYARQNGRWQSGVGIQQQMQDEYGRATAARPRMAKSLDEATRRHNVLLSMHDKLTEAVRLYDRLLDAQMNKQSYGGGVYGHQGPANPSAYYQQNGAVPPQEVSHYANHNQYTAPSHDRLPIDPSTSHAMYPGLPSNRAPSYSNGTDVELSYGAVQSPPGHYPSEQYRQGYFVPHHQQGKDQYDARTYSEQPSGPSAPPAFYSPDAGYPGEQTSLTNQNYPNTTQTHYAHPGPHEQQGHNRQMQSAQYDTQAHWPVQSNGQTTNSASSPVASRQQDYATPHREDGQVHLNEAMASMAVQSPTMRKQPNALDGAMGSTEFQSGKLYQPGHAAGATLDSAPPPPLSGYPTSPTSNTYAPYDASTQLPSMPSAPIASPNAEFGQQHASYEAMTTQGRAMVSPAQQWSRPVETPLIDL
jgi:growth factor-regulated tyrosine kinase substrate